MAVGDLGFWVDSAGGQLPTAKGIPINFKDENQSEGGCYSKTDDATVKIEKVGTYLFISTLQFEGGTGHMTVNAWLEQSAGSSPFWTGCQSGRMTSSAESTCWVKVYGVVYNAQVGDEFVIFAQRGTDSSGTGSTVMASWLQAMQLEPRAVSIYATDLAQTLQGTSTWKVNIGYTNLESDSAIISQVSSEITIAANTKYLVFSCLSGTDSDGTLTQRQSILMVDGTHVNQTISNLQVEAGSSEPARAVNVYANETGASAVTLQLRGFRGQGTAEYQGGGALDGNWETENYRGGICVIALSDTTDFITMDMEYIIQIDSTTEATPYFNRVVKAPAVGSKFAAESIGFSVSDATRALLFANIFSGRKAVTDTTSFTGIGRLRPGGFISDEMGAYSKGVAGSASNLGMSYNLGLVYDLAKGDVTKTGAVALSSSAKGGQPFSTQGLLIGIDVASMGLTPPDIATTSAVHSSTENASFTLVGAAGLKVVHVQKVEASFAAGDSVATLSLSGFSNLTQMVPLGLSSRMASDSKKMMDSRFSASLLSNASLEIRRGGAGSAATVIAYVVEFDSNTTIQSSSFTLSSTTGDFAIDSVSLVNSFVIGWWHANDSTDGPQPSTVNLGFELFSDKVTLHLGASGHDHEGRFWVISNSNISVQRGVSTTTVSPFDAAITAVDLAKTFIAWTDQTTETQYEDEGNAEAFLTTTTNLQFNTGYNSGDHTYYWQVISDSDLVNVQRFRTARSTASSGTFTLSSVDLDLTVALASHPIASNNSTKYDSPVDMSCRSTTYDITSPTNLTWQKTSDSGSAVVEVISFAQVDTATAPIISDVEDERFLPGETGVSLSGSDFLTPQGVGKLELCSSADYASATKVLQVIAAWADTGITFTVNSSGLTGTSFWLVAMSSAGLYSNAYPVQVVNILPQTEGAISSSALAVTFSKVGYETEARVVSSNAPARFFQSYAPSASSEVVSSGDTSTFRLVYLREATTTSVVSSSLPSTLALLKTWPSCAAQVISKTAAVNFLKIEAAVESSFYSNLDYLRDDLTDVSSSLSSTMQEFTLQPPHRLNIQDVELRLRISSASSQSLNYTIRLSDSSTPVSGTIPLTAGTSLYTVSLPKEKVCRSKQVFVQLATVSAAELYSLSISYTEPVQPLLGDYEDKEIEIVCSEEEAEHTSSWRTYRKNYDFTWTKSAKLVLDVETSTAFTVQLVVTRIDTDYWVTSSQTLTPTDSSRQLLELPLPLSVVEFAPQDEEAVSIAVQITPGAAAIQFYKASILVIEPRKKELVHAQEYGSYIYLPRHQQSGDPWLTADWKELSLGMDKLAWFPSPLPFRSHLKVYAQLFGSEDKKEVRVVKDGYHQWVFKVYSTRVWAKPVVKHILFDGRLLTEEEAASFGLSETYTVAPTYVNFSTYIRTHNASDAPYSWLEIRGFHDLNLPALFNSTYLSNFSRFKRTKTLASYIRAWV